MTASKYPTKVRHGRLPFGYDISPDDDKLLIPDEAALDVLHEGLTLLAGPADMRRFSLDQVAAHIVGKTGRKITGEGLHKMVRRLGLYQARPVAQAKLSINGTEKPKTAARKFTEEEKKLRKARLRAGAAKRSLAANAQVISNLTAKQLPPVATETEVILGVPPVLDGTETFVEEELAQEVIFQPNPGPQTDFLAATEDEVFYGGARGGGKTYGAIVDPLRYCHRPLHRALIIRRTMPELRDMIAKAQQLYPKAYPGTKWREQEKEFKFPSGARIEFGYGETMTDVLRYQGQSYTTIIVDEAPQWGSPEVLNFLRSSLRSVDPEIPATMRLTGNPGNVGSAWVKEMFIDPAPKNTRFSVEVKFETPQGPRTKKITRRYIPATVWDNPFLTYDDSYVAMLASLPEMLRRQFLEGDWDAFDNSAFPEFRRDIHVCEPFEIPDGWTKFRGADWGYSSPGSVIWLAVDFDNNLWAYREYYGKGKTADVFAQHILSMEQGENIRYGIMDSSVWSNRGESGPSIAETMLRNGLRWRMSDRSPGSRKAGKLELHRRLATYSEIQGQDDNGDNIVIERPRLRIFSNCVNLIKQMTSLPLDKTNPEDVDTDAEDHAYDALRYACMSRPLNVNHLLTTDIRPDSHSVADNTFGY